MCVNARCVYFSELLFLVFNSYLFFFCLKLQCLEMMDDVMSLCIDEFSGTEFGNKTNVNKSFFSLFFFFFGFAKTPHTQP